MDLTQSVLVLLLYLLIWLKVEARTTLLHCLLNLLNIVVDFLKPDICVHLFIVLGVYFVRLGFLHSLPDSFSCVEGGNRLKGPMKSVVAYGLEVIRVYD